MKLSCDFPDLAHVETTPQAELTRCYVEMLEQRVHNLQQCILRAQVMLAIGEPSRAAAELSRGCYE